VEGGDVSEEEIHTDDLVEIEAIADDLALRTSQEARGIILGALRLAYRHGSLRATLDFAERYCAEPAP
jgi:hypothetical protein